MVDRTGVYTASKGSATRVDVVGPVGEAYTIDVTETSTHGTLTGVKNSDPIPATAAREAIGSFEVVAGSYNAGVNKITQVEVNGVVITNAAVDWTNSNDFTAALLATSINTKASAPEYNAEANGPVVTIKALVADGDASNNFVVKTTCAGNVCVGKVQFQFQATTGYQIDAVYAGGADILGGAITWAAAGSTTAGMATAVAAAINAHTTAAVAHGYLACATGSILSISKAVTQSSDPLIPTYLVGTTFGPGNGVFEVDTGLGGVNSMTALLVYTNFVATQQQGSAIYGYYYMTLVIRDGTPPYVSVVWPGGFQVESVGSGVYRVFGAGRAPAGGPQTPPSVYCVVTDSAGSTANSNKLASN